MRDWDVLELRPAIQISLLPPDKLLAVSGSERHIILNLDAEDLQTIIEQIDGRRTVADVLAALDEDYDSDSLRAVLLSLCGKVLAIKEAGAGPEQPSEQQSAPIGTLPTQVLGQRVGAFISGPLGAALVDILGTAGFTDIQWYDGTVAAAEYVRALRSQLVVGATPNPEPGSITCQYGVRVELPGRPSGAELADLCRARDVILCCLEGTSQRAVLDINRAALDSGTPCYFITPEPGQEASALACGPLLIPWRTGCYECSRTTAHFNRLGTATMTAGSADIAIARTSDTPGWHLLAHTAAALMFRQWQGLVTGRPYPNFSELVYLGMDGSRQPHRYLPTTTCIQCHGLNPAGIDDGTDLRIPGERSPLVSRTIVNNPAGTRCFDFEGALARARSARDKLGVEFSLGPMASHLNQQFPGLGKLPYVHTRADPRFRHDNPLIHYQILDTVYGKGVSAKQAQCSAVFEWFERHLAYYRGQVSVIRAPYYKVREHAIDLPEHARYQLPLDKPVFQPDRNIDWVWAHSLTRERPVLVPAALMFLRGGRFLGSELNLPEPGSTGISAGSTYEEAVLQGLLEAVEHDSWFSAWRTGCYCPELDLTTVSDAACQDWLATLASAGFSARARLLTSDIKIPTFEVTLLSTDALTSWTQNGFGASLNPAIALKRALTESLQAFCAFADDLNGRLGLRAPNGLCNRDSYLERGFTGRVSGRISWRDIEDMQPESEDILDHIDACIALIRRAVPESEVCMFDFSLPQVPEVAVVRAFVTCIQDQVSKISHSRPRLRRYRRICEGDSAPLVELTDMYLGEIR